MSNQAYETPYQQLTKLNNLFSYYKTTSAKEGPPKIKHTQNIQQFSMFQIPTFYKKLSQYQEKEEIITQQQLKQKQEEKLFTRHQDFMGRTLSTLKKDKKLSKSHSMSVFRQIHLRKPFDGIEKDEMVSQLPEISRAATTKINYRVQAQKYVQLKNQSQHSVVNPQQVRKAQLHNQQQEDFKKNLQSKLMKIVADSAPKINQHPGLNDWERHFKDTYKHNYQSYALSKIAQQKVNCFETLISTQIDEMDKFYESQTQA